MNSVILIIRSNFRQRKLLSLTVALALFIVATLMNSAVGILTMLQKPFDQVFEQANASHIILLYDAQVTNGKEIIDWLNENPQVEHFTFPTTYYSFNGNIFYKHHKIDMLIQLTEHTNDHLKQDRLTILKGKKALHPGENEIWIPNYIAINNGIEPGDTLQFATRNGVCDLVVAALVSDPHYGSGMINPTRAWVSGGGLLRFGPVTELTAEMIGIRLKEKSTARSLIQKLKDELHYEGIALDYFLFQTAYYSLYQILGLIILIFSFLALLVSMFITRATITKSIHDDYRLIGIYKALGLSQKQVVGLYVVQFCLIGLLAIISGIICSYFLVESLINIQIKTLGQFSPEPHSPWIYFITFIPLFIIVLITSVITSYKIAKVIPSVAIRQGAPDISTASYSEIGNFSESQLPLSILLALRFFVNERGRTIVTFGIFCTAVFIVAFSINVSNSFEKLKYNKSAWGFENGEMQVTRNESAIIKFTHEQILEIFAGFSQIKSTSPFSYHQLTIVSAGKALRSIFGKAYVHDPTLAGLDNLEGRHPEKQTEISLCTLTSREFKKTVGDSITVFMEGQRVTYSISGIYQDASNMGQGFRLRSTAIENLNPIYEPNIYSVHLKSQSDKKLFKEQLVQKLGESIVINPDMEERISQMGIISGVNTALGFISVFFLLTLLISIWNNMLMNVMENKKTFGVFRALGFSSAQLQQMLIFKSILIATLALLTGIPLALILTPMLMSSLTGGIGLIEFPFVIDLVKTALIIPMIMLIVIASSWLLSFGASETNPRSLISE